MAFQAKPRPGILLRGLYIGKYGLMFEEDRNVEKTHHCLVCEDLLPIKKCTNVVPVGKKEFKKPILDG